MVALLMLANVVSYADRTNIGITVLKFGYSDSDEGLVLSAFYFGYMITQLVAGYLIPRIGPKKTLLIGLTWWTVCDVLTVPSAHILPVVMMARAGVGLGEGVLYPSQHALSSVWFPLSERARMVGTATAGQDLGTVLALGVSPQLVDNCGWRYSYVMFGSLSVIWIGCFYTMGYNSPAESPRVSLQELQLIQEGLPSSNGKSQHFRKMPWGTFAKSHAVRAVIVSHICFNYGLYVLLSWLPKYFKDEMGVKLSDHFQYGVTPYICGYIGSIFWAAVADRLMTRHKWPLLTVRRTMNSIGMFGSGSFTALVAILSPSDPAVATLLLACGMFLGRAVNSGYWTNMLDLGPRHAGQLMAVSNTFATVPGIVGNTITGWVLSSTGSWPTVFAIASCVYFMGGVVFLGLSDAQNIYSVEDDDEGPDADDDDHVTGGGEGGTAAAASGAEEDSLLLPPPTTNKFDVLEEGSLQRLKNSSIRHK